MWSLAHSHAAFPFLLPLFGIRLFSVPLVPKSPKPLHANHLICPSCSVKSRNILKMQGSALIGSPPANPKDALIRIGLKSSSGSVFNPNRLLPYGPPRPSPDLSDESNAYKVRITEIVCLILILTVTLGRFWARATNESLSFGMDDLMAIPACVCGIGYMGIVIAYTGPCYGRHMWFCTYEQIETLQVVRFSKPLLVHCYSC